MRRDWSLLSKRLFFFILFLSCLPLGQSSASDLNLAPDCSNAASSPSSIWPPNHKFTDIAITGVTDPDGDPLTIAVQCILQDEEINATGDGNFIYDADGINTSSPSVRNERSGNNDGRVYHIDFIATDSHGARCGGEVTVSVPHNKKQTAIDEGRLFQSVPSDNTCGQHDINNPPWIYSEPVLSGASDKTYQYDVNAHDPDGDLLTYGIVAGPAGLTIDTASGLLAWASPEAGIFSITISVEDGRGGSDQQTYTLFINGPPEITSEPIAVCQTGSLYAYQVVAVDPNNDVLAYGIVNGPQGMTIDPASGLVRWPEPAAGEFSVLIQVTDGRGGSARQDFSLFVNGPPVITSAPVTEQQAASPYKYQVIAEDPNNDTLNYELAAAPPGMAIDSATGLVSWDSPLPGEYSVRISVSDGHGGSDEQTYTLKIIAPPTIEAAADPFEIDSGKGSWLNWHTTNVDTVTIDQGIGAVALNGCFGAGSYYPDATNCGEAVLVTPEATTTYTLTASGPGGTATAAVTVVVKKIPPTVALFAKPVDISRGETSQLYWHSTNADTVSIDQGIGTVAPNSDDETSSGKTVAPESNTTYTITASGPGGTATASVTITVTALPPTVDITAEPATINSGEQSRLIWYSGNADTVTIDREIGAVRLNSSDPGRDIIIYPEATVTYTIIATGPGGTVTDSVTVNVNTVPPPSVSIIAAPNQIHQGQSSWLYWHSANADTVAIDRNIGQVPANGCYGGEGGYPGIIAGECGEGVQVTPQATTTYTITASGPGGTVTSSVTVTVNDTPPAAVEIIAAPATIQSGNGSWLYWHSTNADTVSIDRNIGTVATNGCIGGEGPGFPLEGGGACGPGITVSPAATTTYTITATGPGGTAFASITVTVELPPPAVEIIADPASISSGDTSWLYWHSTNAEIVSISQGIGVVAANGCSGGEGPGFPLEGGGACGNGISVSPQTTTTYTVIAAGPGGTASASVTITVEAAPPPTVKIITDSVCINPGDTSWLYWHSTDADSVTIAQQIGVVALNGCYGYGGEVIGFPLEGEEVCGNGVSVSPQSTTTYTITATGPGGSSTAGVTVNVGCLPPPDAGVHPVADIYADSYHINSGETTFLYWYFSNADTASIDQGIGNISCNDIECTGEKEVTPTSTTTYTLTATNPVGTATDSITIFVDDPLRPAIDVWTNSADINTGDSISLYWDAYNTDSLSIEPGVGTVTPDLGEVQVAPTATTTYTFTATGSGGTATGSLTIYVCKEVKAETPPTARLYPESPSLFRGRTTSLHWETTNADSVTIDQGIGAVALQSDAGGLVISPDTTTTYTLTGGGLAGQVSVSVTVIVIDALPPLVDLIAWPDTIELGRDSTLAWSSADADSVVIESSAGTVIDDIPVNSGADGRQVAPETTTTYTITATGPGGTATDSVTVAVLPKIEITTCTQPALAGDPCTLTIHTVNGETVTVDQGVGAVLMQPVAELERSGTVTVNPVAETVYTVTATGNGGTSTAAVQIKIAPKVDFHADNGIIELGSPVSLHWTTVGADTVTILSDVGPDIGDVALNSDPAGLAVTPARAMTYTLLATGVTQEKTRATVRILVNDFSRPPIVNLFKAEPATIEPGATAELQWKTANMQQARIDNGIGDVGQFGTIRVSPQQTTTYTLVVQGPQGFVTATATVVVSGTYAEGTFGDLYNNLIPDNSTVTLDGARFSLLTGRCQDRDGNPLAGVTVSILGKPEFGSVVTDAQGRYSIPVIGSARYTVAMAKPGFLPSHRKATVLNNRIEVLDTVALIEPDSLSTLIDFSAGSEPVLFHDGSYLSDGRGRRRMALTMFAGALSEPMEVATTEYSTAAALPASLPPNTSYGYVSEIGHGQNATVFAAPVIAWVDNFLGFAVGQTVPVGWYDRNRGLWIPRDNGLVVQLLDTDNDGTVDGLDINGDQQPDDLDGDGEYGDEVAGLAPGELQAGATYYRFPVDRTGPWSCGWPYAPLAAPAPASAPPAPSFDLQSCPSGDCELVQQDIAIPGTDFTLHYSEARVPAYQPQITIPVTGDTIPAHAEGVLVRMTVAGRVYEESLNAEPNRTVRFQWDGRDYLGNELTGPVTAGIAIGYVYSRNYGLPGEFTHSFSQTGSGDASIAGREKYIAWHHDRLQLERLVKSDDFIAEGWTLSAQHQVNTTGPAALHLGSGALLLLNDQWATHTIFYGNGKGYGIFVVNPEASTHDYYPGTFGELSGIAVDDACEYVFWSNAGFDVLWRFGTDDAIDPPRMGAPFPFAGHYDPTEQFLLKDPSGIAIDDSGNVYYADSGNHLIRKGQEWNYLGGAANYLPFAGNGQPGYSGDGGTALAAAFSTPGQLALDQWGNLYIIDSDNHVIRKIAADGTIETIAGNGTGGSDGDNGPALAASISPRDIAVDAHGNLFLTEPEYARVRRIDVSGIITTVAGTGVPGFGGVNGPAASAQLYSPESIGVDSLGNLYIGDATRLLAVDRDSMLRKIRRMVVAGVLTTDLQDRIYVNDFDQENVYRIGRPTFNDLWERDYYRVPDGAGTDHFFSALGKHLYTGYPTHPRYSFIYDLDNLLIAVLDGNGATIVTIHRDASGRVLSLETAEGLTTLTIDTNNHLTDVLLPDNGSVTMTYTDQGLLTDFNTVFVGSIRGVVSDSAGGTPLPDVTVNLATTRGTASTRTNGTGAYSFADVAPGTYTLQYSKPGYFNQAATGTMVFGDSHHTRNVSLLAYPTLTLSIDSPQPDTVLAGPTVQVTGQVTAGATITVNGVAATVTGTQFSADISLAGEGQQTITASAVDSYGQQVSTQVAVYYYLLPTATLTTDKNPLQPGEQATLTWNSTSSDHCLLEPLGQEVDCTGSMTVIPGSTTTYTLSVSGPGGNAAASVTIEVQSLLSLSILSPAPGSTVNKPEITLSGTVTNQTGNETGIVVNGVPAQVNGNQLFVNGVRLTEGENTITVTARDTAGNEATESITVFLDTSVQTDWIELLVNPSSGVAPLTATLTANYHLSFTPASPPQISNTGPDNVDFTWVSDTELTLTFQTPGIYTLYGEQTDPQGNTIRGETMVNVLDRTKLDALLQAKWEGMKEALRSGDIEGALEYHYPSVRDDYRAIYNGLGNRLSGLIDQMQEIQLVFVEEGRAQYRIRRNITMTGAVETVTFYIYFYIDKDGIWRIENY